MPACATLVLYSQHHNVDYKLIVVDPELEPYPQQLTTALFSFLYHLASYENGQLRNVIFFRCLYV